MTGRAFGPFFFHVFAEIKQKVNGFFFTASAQTLPKTIRCGSMDSGCLVIGGGSAVFLPSNKRSWLRAMRVPCDLIDTTASSNDVSVCERANDTCFGLEGKFINYSITNIYYHNCGNIVYLYVCRSCDRRFYRGRNLAHPAEPGISQNMRYVQQ